MQHPGLGSRLAWTRRSVKMRMEAGPVDGIGNLSVEFQGEAGKAPLRPEEVCVQPERTAVRFYDELAELAALTTIFKRMTDIRRALGAQWAPKRLQQHSFELLRVPQHT
jgi:hypothetical protein